MVKENTLWYNEDKGTHYYVLFISSDTDYVFVFWLGNGDLRYININDLGVLIEEYPTLDDGLTAIQDLIDTSLISGIDE